MSDKYPEMKQDATVCFCNSNKAWGGGERWHLESALYLAREGYNVILACGKGDPLWRMAEEVLNEDSAAGKQGVEPLSERFHLADWSFSNLSFLNPFRGSAFSRFLALNRVSHLILNLPADLKVGVPAAGRKNSFQGAVRVYYRRGSAIPVKASGMNGYLFSRLTALIANSKETAECVRQASIMDPARIRVIYNGLDAAAFDRELRRAGLEPGRASSGACADTELKAGQAFDGPASFSAERPLIIGNAGRLSAQKAQKYLLHMSAELKRRAFPHKLLIAGDGELREDLLKLASALELAPCGERALFSAERLSEAGLQEFRSQEGEVCFAGFLKNMAPFWAATDLFALSSVWEGFGYVLAEAMLAEKPLLAFDCNSMPELVLDGLNGVLLEAPAPGEGDAAVGARLADKVMQLAANPAGMRELGRAGRAFCLKNFDQRVAMSRLEDLLFGGQDAPVLTFDPGLGGSGGGEAS